MPKISSLNTGRTIELPEWENGFTKKEYEVLVDGLKRACDSNIDDYDSELTASVNDLLCNLRLFGLHEYYEQAYKDILKHNEVEPKQNINDINELDSPKESLIYKADELLAEDIVNRILIERSR